MALKNRQEFVPEGYFAYVAELDWTSPKHVSFVHGARAIQEKRIANPQFKWPTDIESVMRWLEQYTEKRLREQFGDAAAAQWIILDSGGGGAAPFSPHLRRSLGGGAVADKAKLATAGVGVIIDWLGDGLTPVDTIEANARAAVCVTCPKNSAPTGVQAVYEKVADGLKLLLNAKSEMKLATDHDLQLQTCQVCDCSLPLKVWAPMDHVKKHTSEKVLAELPTFCWIRKGVSG